MKRRTFIKDSALLAMGMYFAPAFLSSCKEDSLLDDLDYDGKVIIIGAGAAGLYAGYLLKSKGIEFEILEASSKIGGRMGKLEGFADYPLDTGAQWLHGRDSIVGELIQESNTSISLDDSDMYYWHEDRIKSSLPKDVEDIFEEDNLPDVSYEAYAIQKGFGDDYKFIVEGIAGDQGADASKLSAKWNQAEEEEWSSGEEDYKFKKTFFDLFNDEIIPSIKDDIKLNTIVKKVDYNSNTILINDSDEKSYTCDKLIVTVPITILQDQDIEFSPALASEKVAAFQKIGMGAGMKVFLRFSSKFYHDNILGGPICAAYANEKEGKVGNDHVLLAFVMGEQAEYLSSLGSDNAIVQELLKELDGMYQNKATPALLDSHVEDWTTNPFVRGAYSFSTVGIGDARKIAAQSVADKVYFAGEAMNLNGHHQTVHGAVETGYQQLVKLLESAQ
jgi:monoamine oxidase